MKYTERKPELLAPAGSYKAFMGAINAGADAVYMAGDSFGARAYAKNLTTEEYLRALDYAHLFDRKIYMTVNTVLKNREYDRLFEYIRPYYEGGLDGVIVQEPSLIKFFSENFPGMEIHASTQMTVTTDTGAKFLSSLGVNRVVPARELTLPEVTRIVDTGIDVECFIHGSMCYCYSGQCLFSSMLGDRSGNRGRCAQPCRLPYGYGNERASSYFLSLKDMCTLSLLPKLIETGIASFKIEGRMKNPAYSAGVTSIYRFLIDSYYKNPDSFKVDSDMYKTVENLYLRTSRTTGYYETYHGKKMITPDSPSYMGTSEELCNKFNELYCENPIKKDVSISAKFEPGQKAQLTVNGLVTVEGDEVSEALNKPLSNEELVKRLSKSGDTMFNVESVDAQVNGNVFMPVSSINSLRRDALAAYEQVLLKSFKRECSTKEITETYTDDMTGMIISEYNAFVSTSSQIAAVLESTLINAVTVPCEIITEGFDEQISLIKGIGKKFYIRLPEVVRSDSFTGLTSVLDKFIDYADGVYVNQIDSLAYIIDKFPKIPIRSDINLYAVNDRAATFIKKYCESFTLSPELKKEEIAHIGVSCAELFVYGRIPLMNSANCVNLSNDRCTKYVEKADFAYISDRTKASLPVRLHCSEKMCYNTIYNSVPVSLHKQFDAIKGLPSVNALQFRFSDESNKQIRKVLSLYEEITAGNDVDCDFEYTNGHFKNGVL